MSYVWLLSLDTVTMRWSRLSQDAFILFSIFSPTFPGWLHHIDFVHGHSCAYLCGTRFFFFFLWQISRNRITELCGQCMLGIFRLPNSQGHSSAVRTRARSWVWFPSTRGQEAGTWMILPCVAVRFHFTRAVLRDWCDHSLANIWYCLSFPITVISVGVKWYLCTTVMCISTVARL